jgi:hypothetical protein
METLDPLRLGFVHRVLAAANAQLTPGYHDEFKAALNAISTLESRREVRLEIGQRLSEVTSPIGAGNLAVWLGASVEAGIEAEPTTQPIMESLLHWCKVLPDPVAPPSPVLLEGLDRLGQGLVAHLSRAPELRAEYRANATIMEQLEHAATASNGAAWVCELLRKVSGELIVLHVAGRIGFVVRYEQLSNNFHLFTLLQGELSSRVPDGRSVPANLLAIARGERHDSAEDAAWWHYGQGSMNTPNFAGMVFGEMSPAAIGAIDGQQVLLLWPPIFKERSWDAGFFGPSLEVAPVDVKVIRELTREDVKTWWTRLQLPDVSLTSEAAPSVPAASPWWKFW